MLGTADLLYERLGSRILIALLIRSFTIERLVWMRMDLAAGIGGKRMRHHTTGTRMEV